MLSWGEVRRALSLDVRKDPIMREKRGKKIIFWFENGNGDVADIIIQIKERGIPAEIVWDDKEGMAGICLDFAVVRS